MVVTEQVDAYRSFGTDPIRKLAVPRVLAAMLMLPALTIVADVVGIFSGFVFGVLDLGVSPGTYILYSQRALTELDLLSSVVKAFAFGALIGTISTYHGLGTRRATEAVGVSTTKTMVACVLGVLLVDVVLTKLFVTLGE
jgi:phospholipid/cholesterol/gamma-HCH transport system permease protein